MPNLTLLGWMFLVWGIITAVLALLLIYRSIVGMKEDDQLFLDKAESRFEAEQQEIQNRLDHLKPYLKGFGIASAGLLLCMLGLVTYRVAMALYEDTLVK